MTDTTAPARVPRRAIHPVKAALWGAVAAIGVGGAMAGAWLWTLCAAGALVLAAMLPGFTMLSGLRFPPWCATGVLLYCCGAFLLGELVGLYATVWWDVILHLIAAGVLAQIGWALALLLTAGAPSKVPLWVAGTLAFGFSMMVGGMWEILEFTLDQTLGTNAQRSGLPDTMSDLIFDAVGAAWGAVAVGWRLSGGPALPGSGLAPAWMALNPVVYPEWPRWAGRSGEDRRRPLAGEDGALQRRR